MSMDTNNSVTNGQRAQCQSGLLTFQYSFIFSSHLSVFCNLPTQSSFPPHPHECISSVPFFSTTFLSIIPLLLTLCHLVFLSCNGQAYCNQLHTLLLNTGTAVHFESGLPKYFLYSTVHFWPLHKALCQPHTAISSVLLNDIDNFRDYIGSVTYNCVWSTG